MSGKKPKLLKKVQGGKVYEGHVFVLENVRLSYLHAAQPYAGKNDDGTEGKPSYSVVSIAPKKTHKGIHDEIVKAFAEIKAANKNARVPVDKLCVRDGDGQDKDEYAGAWTISAREKKRPKCRDINAELLETPEDIEEELYSGCYGDVVIKLWFQDNSYGKRINANFLSVRKRADGEPFGEGAIDDEDMYDEVDDDSNGFAEDTDDDI